MKSKPIASMESSSSSRPVILVTGAHGLLGSRLVPVLARNIPTAEIIIVTRDEMHRRAESPPITTIHGDLRDEKLWAGLPATITHVFHLAGVIPWKTEERYQASLVQDNLLPIANLIQYSRTWSNLRQIVYSSSVSVYAPTDKLLDEDSPRHPANLYAASKLAGEELLHSNESGGVRIVSLRLSSLYAHGQYEGTVLPIMVSRARHKQNITIFGDGTRTQDFLHCEDAARALMLCFEKEAQGVYNVGTGTPVTMTELAQTASRVFSDGETKIIYEPTKGDGDLGIKLDITKARRELNYEPQVQLEQGLSKLKQEMENTNG
jgi:nucleoside-diphosphate-sugar epimerase